MKAIGAFNDKVCLDYVFVHDTKEEKHAYLHILDPAGGYNLFVWVPGRKPEAALSAFMGAWIHWAGFPKSVWMDRDGAFEGIFLETLQKANVDCDYVPAEAHWQAGEVEAFNRAFRYVAERIIDEKQLSGEQDMKVLGPMVSAAMNDKVRACGASANQWVFGRSPRAKRSSHLTVSSRHGTTTRRTPSSGCGTTSGAMPTWPCLASARRRHPRERCRDSQRPMSQVNWSPSGATSSARGRSSSSQVGSEAR